MSFIAYPLQFRPILKDKIWGGTKLRSLLNKPTDSNKCGESWELSAVQGDVSVVANGVYTGQPLAQLLDENAIAILGTEVYKSFGAEFPLLFKFIDAGADLSIQVHPNDQIAQERHNAKGKTEMWYIMQADAGAQLTIGFRQKSARDEYLRHLKNNTLPEILESFAAQAGDAYFLETGTVHAIGAGILLAEIQQTSDVTYRIYDYDRIGDDGKKRELHTAEALDAINYDVSATKRESAKQANIGNMVAECKFFTTDFIPLDGIMKAAGKKHTFTVYMCVEGAFELCYNDHSILLRKGDTILIPASMGDYKLSGTASLLEIYI